MNFRISMCNADLRAERLVCLYIHTVLRPVSALLPLPLATLLEIRTLLAEQISPLGRIESSNSCRLKRILAIERLKYRFTSVGLYLMTALVPSSCDMLMTP